MQDIIITIIQSPLLWEDVEGNLRMFSAKLNQLDHSTDLIVLPEMFTTGFSMNSVGLAEEMNGKTLEWMRQKAAEKNCAIAGSFIASENKKYYNRFVWMRSDGSFDTYDKRHLFRMAEEHERYSAGNKRIIVDLKGWKICPLICYDLRFPVWSRNRLLHYEKNKAVEMQYDMLIYIANWPEPRRTAWQTLLAARAHENQAYVVGVNRIGTDGNGIAYSGDSVVFDPKGIKISNMEEYQDSIETVILSRKTLDEYRFKFPAALDGDEFSILFPTPPPFPSLPAQ